MGFDTDEKMRKFVDKNRMKFLQTLPTKLFIEGFPNFPVGTRERLRCVLIARGPFDANSELLDSILRVEDFAAKFITFSREHEQCLNLAYLLEEELHRLSPRPAGGYNGNSPNSPKPMTLKNNLSGPDPQRQTSTPTQSQNSPGEGATPTSNSSCSSSFFLTDSMVEDALGIRGCCQGEDSPVHNIDTLKALPEEGQSGPLLPNITTHNSRSDPALSGGDAAKPLMTKSGGIQCEEDLQFHSGKAFSGGESKTARLETERAASLVENEAQKMKEVVRPTSPSSTSTLFGNTDQEQTFKKTIYHRDHSLLGVQSHDEEETRVKDPDTTLGIALEILPLKFDLATDKADQVQDAECLQEGGVISSITVSNESDENRIEKPACGSATNNDTLLLETGFADSSQCSTLYIPLHSNHQSENTAQTMDSRVALDSPASQENLSMHNEGVNSNNHALEQVQSFSRDAHSATVTLEMEHESGNASLASADSIGERDLLEAVSSVDQSRSGEGRDIILQEQLHDTDLTPSSLAIRIFSEVVYYFINHILRDLS